MFEPRSIKPCDRLSSSQCIVVWIMNLLLLVELTVCMYVGQQDPDTLTLFFLKTFPIVALMTVIISRVLIRCLPGPGSDGETR